MTTENAVTIFTDLNAIWLDENGILNVRSVREGEMDLTEVKKCFEAYEQLGCKENKALQLLDLTVPVSITKESRDYVDQEAHHFFIASAVVTESLAVRLIVNFMRMFRPHIPLKMFSNRDEALKWLLTFRS